MVEISKELAIKFIESAESLQHKIGSSDLELVAVIQCEIDEMYEAVEAAKRKDAKS